MDTLLVNIGVIVATVGILVFAFGKKLPLIRYYFGDRSMFSQFRWGFNLTLLGLLFLYIGGFHV